MADFKPIETQEAFDAAIKDRIERAKKAAADEAAKKYEGWTSPDDAKKSAEQITALTAQVADLTAKNAAAELGAMRTRLAAETGLPYALAGRLTGDTEEAIKADAEAFAKLIAPAPSPSPQFSPETPATNAQDAALMAMLGELNT